MTDNTPETKQRDPRAHAAAKADINKEVQLKVRELKSEAAEIDVKIRECEIAATRETDDALVAELLAERSRLIQRKEALPFLLRGTQARALKRQAEALFAEAEDLKPDLALAEQELEAAIARVPDLERQLEEAKKAVEETTKRRDQLSLHYSSLTKSAGLARADAGCIERGEPMKFGSNGFIGE